MNPSTALVFQNFALFPWLTVQQNIAVGLSHLPLAASDREKRVRQVIEAVGLAGSEEAYPKELSGGMKQRVGLARAIIYRPQIVLYDEPTTGLDPIVSDSIDKLILRVRDRLDVTTVVVTHDLRSARRLGQRIMMLHNQKIYATGTPDEIFNSQDPVVRRFIDGESDPKELYF